MSRPLVLHLRAAAVLVGLCLLGSWSTLPLLITAREHAGQSYTVGTPALMAIAALQTILLFGVTAFLGLRAAGAIRLPGAPLVLQAVGGAKASPLGRPLAVAAGLGVAAGVIVVLADLLIFQGKPISFAAPRIDTALGLRLLTGFLYGGINEEVLMRLFLVSGLAYLLVRLFTKDRTPSPWMTWGAIVVAAVIFGIGHLPFTSLLTAITPMIVLRAILLNGIVGILCGRLYVLFGIEAAMAAHAAAHLPLQLAASAFQP
ncbi:CPBP family glutamic-type intramembrane protease [Microvirga puerhi]|uniref:CPBP family intramembrane metalloprotease n=1 Tax=Microvirga puerhi TaxID=2876078 RepID=A0ABS7VIG5_9HYPH|nr:CPBP family glutamic-type intramembrane protease [Microvirga puerhi]MBZ6074812.1 CPBP family intramembrane metalloprotease [Microvirga puerhi]